MQIRRKVLKGLVFGRLWGSSSPCLGKDPCIAKYSGNTFDAQSKPIRMDLPPWSPSQERVQCVSTLGTQEACLWDFPSKLGKLNSANAVLTHGDRSYSKSGIHTASQSQQAGLGGSPSQTIAAVTQSVLQLLLHGAGDAQWDACIGTPSPNSRRWNWFSDAERVKGTKQMSGGCSTALPLWATLWSNHSFNERKGRKTNHPAVC